MPLFRGSSRFESLILSLHSRFRCECNNAEDAEVGDRAEKTPRVLREATCCVSLSTVTFRKMNYKAFQEENACGLVSFPLLLKLTEIPLLRRDVPTSTFAWAVSVL